MNNNTNRYKTRLFTRGSNSDGNIGLAQQVSETSEFTEVTMIQNHTPDESKQILEMMDLATAGRSSILFSTRNNRIFVCGMNNYGQLGLSDTEPIFLFKSIEFLIVNELERAKAIEQNSLDIALSNSNASPQTERFLRERLNKKFERIESIDFAEMGWFHTILVINKNLVFGTGHSYFGQLYDHSHNESFQYIQVVQYNYTSIIDKIEKTGQLIDPFQEDKITHLACGTFSTSIVFNERRVYACGEITPFKMENSFELDIQDKLGEDNILQIFHLDNGVALYTSSESMIMLEKPETFKRMENVAKMVGGHLCSDVHYVLKDSPDTLRRWSTDNSTDSLYYSLSNIGSNYSFFPGYYHILVCAEKKYIYTDASFVEDEHVIDEENMDLTLSTLIGPNSKVGDEGNKALAKLLLCEQYYVQKIASGSDFSFILIYHQSSKEQEEMKTKLHKQVTDERKIRNCLNDISIVSTNVQLY